MRKTSRFLYGSLLSIGLGIGLMVIVDPAQATVMLGGGSTSEEIANLRKAAAAGSPDAALELGVLLSEAGNAAGERWLRQALAAGKAEARTPLGSLLLRTSNQGIDLDRAAEGLSVLRDAAVDESEANLILGQLYAVGNFVIADFEQAEAHFTAAIDLGDAAGWYRLGWLHSGEVEGLDEQIEPEKAIEYLEKGFERGEMEAGRLLVKMLNEGTRVPKDEARAFRLVKAAAETSPEASLFLAELYREGKGTEADPEKAVDAIEAAAELGHSGAQNQLAMIYLQGDEAVAADRQKAREWFEKAAEQNFPAARFNLALLLVDGSEVSGDDQHTAVEHLVAAASGGLALAQDRLGSWYRDGTHVSSDPLAAMAWFREASNAGLVSAKINLAHLLELNAGRQGALASAIELYKEAASAGHPVAYYQLARLAASGVTGQVDPVTAYAYLATAADSGFPDAVLDLPDLRKQLSDEQVAEADAMRKDLPVMEWGDGGEAAEAPKDGAEAAPQSVE